jgi:tRNA pseudouridine13 synthase
LQVSELDRLLGIEVYATKTSGVGGKIRESAEDFIVEETLVDGSKASVTGDVPPRVIGSTQNKQRFLLCTLVKRNWDTFLAMKNVAKSLGLEQKSVQFAGIKDAKALTAQYITLEKVSAEEATKVELKDVQVHPVGYVREPLSLFYLLGNHFTITIKNFNLPEAEAKEQIEQTMQQLTAIGGILNFYGHQRFGTTRPITHIVGKALSQGKFEEAAMLFLANPSSYEHPAARQARLELQETKNFKQASETFPKPLRFERLMLLHLAEHPADYVGAFKQLPPKLQALFVQAHQSYLFNRFISERVKAGLPISEATEGDFVVGVERSGLPLTTTAKVVTPEKLGEINTQVKAGKLRVALPIVGFKQKLSQGAMGQIESKVLAQEGVESGNVWNNELTRVGGKGGLRALVTPVLNYKLTKIGDGATTSSFMLHRGCYATIVLREFIKPPNPLTAGF